MDTFLRTLSFLLLSTFTAVSFFYILIKQDLNGMKNEQTTQEKKDNSIVQNNIKLNTLNAPIEHYKERITKKPYGIKVSPGDSPVKPEKFSGYHTGTDFEILPGEEIIDVPVYAICDGPLILKRSVSGYGGALVQQCKLGDVNVTVIYGHIKLDSVKAKVKENIKKGERLGVLGKGYSAETGGERKHLHLGIHYGHDVNLLGYVKDYNELKKWLNPQIYLKS